MKKKEQIKQLKESNAELKAKLKVKEVYISGLLESVIRPLSAKRDKLLAKIEVLEKEKYTEEDLAEFSLFALREVQSSLTYNEYYSIKEALIERTKKIKYNKQLREDTMSRWRARRKIKNNEERFNAPRIGAQDFKTVRAFYIDEQEGFMTGEEETFTTDDMFSFALYLLDLVENGSIFTTQKIKERLTDGFYCAGILNNWKYKNQK